ncbi:hypothetical protein ACFQ7W_08340 [Streptomyces niveus]|uniref:hypothetical protein n=1 Tax=Streptomyces niveus TaxID=193462 RepID=UPI0036772470
MMVGEDGLRDGGDPVGAAMESPQVNYNHFDGIPDRITMSARTENAVLFDNVTVKNITEWQTAC